MSKFPVVNPTPTPKRVPKKIAHKDGFLESTNETAVVIEGAIARGQRVDWRATAEDLGRQLLDAREREQTFARNLKEVAGQLSNAVHETTTCYSRVRRMQNVFRSVRGHWAWNFLPTVVKVAINTELSA